MAGLGAALWAETLKARRGKALPLVGLAFLLLPLVGALFMIILKDPAYARQLGLISAKAQLSAGTADWPAYLGLLAQGTALGGFVAFSMAASWIFGREYADHTAKDLLALPATRSAVVMAKLVILGAWAVTLAALAYALALALGLAIGLPGWSPALVAQSGWTLAVTTTLTLALAVPVALAASAGRGYLPAMGFALLMLFLAQIIAVMGWGAYFPYSVPALYSGAAGPRGGELGGISYVIVALTGLAGLAGTLAWWEYADHGE